ncbi:MAG TPA: hypothetical protein VGR67_09090 [Candidatus Polarisedimenticolia bacterium]|nr:hypothetical protein [Candidatus Polarisedimenticolia bacterium]
MRRIGTAALLGMVALGTVGASFGATPADRPAAGSAFSEPQRILWRDGVKNAYPHWSKDGARILFQSNRTGKWQIYVMNQDGSGEVQITQGEANNNFPDWSPDDSEIAFISDRDGNMEVYAMRADGSALRNLSKSPTQDIHPYWTPDGKKILFNSGRDGGQLQIYEVNPDGTGLRRLATSEDEDTCARVSPAGDRIVYLANLHTGSDDVMMRDRNGSNPKNVTHDPPADGWPAWTPDGRHIVFSSQRNGPFALYLMNSDGSQARQLTDPKPPHFDGRANVSRDGKKIVFNRESGETIGILVVELR